MFYNLVTEAHFKTVNLYEKGTFKYVYCKHILLCIFYGLCIKYF